MVIITNLERKFKIPAHVLKSCCQNFTCFGLVHKIKQCHDYAPILCENLSEIQKIINSLNLDKHFLKKDEVNQKD